MLTTIGKQFSFEAAHVLPQHEGKCSKLHGHSYTVEVTVSGQVAPDGPSRGMVVDFGELSAFWKQHLEPRLDHTFLNDLIVGGLSFYPTAENLAAFILAEFQCMDLFSPEEGPKISSVTVYETASSFASAMADGFDD